MNTAFYVFFLIGLFQGFLLAIYRIEIFDYNAELGFYTLAKKVTREGKVVHFLRDKRQAYKESPCVQKIWILFTRVLGVCIGWIMLWLLIDKRLDYFHKSEIKWEDLALFTLAYVGVSGRLPTIAESVQDWFKR